MYKYRILNILIVFNILISLINFSYATELDTNNTANTTGDGRFHSPEALSIPEKDINLKIENLTLGCEVYLMIPSELFEYNMQKFVENNIENEYMLQKQKAEKIKEYYDKKDCLGYINFLKEEGHEINENTLELRHYAFSINDSIEIIGNIDYNNLSYIQFKINSKNNEFKVVMKDYLVNYDCSQITFLIDEYGTKTYIPVSEYNFVQNAEKENLNECNITYTYHTDEDYEEINKAISITYTVIIAILIAIVLLIIILRIIKYRKNKLEIQKRLFWKNK